MPTTLPANPLQNRKMGWQKSFEVKEGCQEGDAISREKTSGQFKAARQQGHERWL
jgi:hypothetical protein